MSHSTVPNEEWRQVPGHPDYDVSNLGRVRSRKKSGEPRVMAPFTDKAGYVSVSMDGFRMLIHRAVASAWHGPCPNGKEVDHINNVRGDNRPDNLRYLTRQENLARRAPRAPLEECAEGHKLAGENLYIRPSGSRCCRICANQLVRDLRLGNGNAVFDCTISECKRPAYARRGTDTAICEMHYQRERRALRRTSERHGRKAAPEKAIMTIE